MTAALLASATVAGCSHRDDDVNAALSAVRDGTAKAAMQRYFDGHRQCAPVLSYWRDAGMLDAEANSKAAAALVSTGLIEPAPGNPHPGRGYFRPAASARKWFIAERGTGTPLLCFARRRVRDVTLLVDSSSNAKFKYTFYLVDPAPWVSRPDMRAAFPGVALSIGDDNTYAGEEDVPVKNGLPLMQPIFSEYLNSPFLSYNVNFTGRTSDEMVASKYE